MTEELTAEEIRKLQDAIENGMSRKEAAKAFGLCYATACKYAKDMPSEFERETIKGWGITVLKELTTKGYFLPSTSAETVKTERSYHSMKGIVPVRKVQSHSKNVYYLEGREKEAMEAFLESLGRKVVSHHEVVPIMRLFGAARGRDKESLFGRLPAETRENFRKFRGKRSL